MRARPSLPYPATQAVLGVTVEGAVVVEGEAGTETYRQFFTDDAGAKISPWHDIALRPAGAGTNMFNMVTEIPKYGTAKMEVDTKGENNPIVQDMKKGKLRFYHGPIFWNYGCLPQTWENPNEKHPELGCFGDDDPIDVVEIGASALEAGSVTPVKLMNSSISSSRVLLGGEGGGVGGSSLGGGGIGLLKCCGTAWRDWYIVCQPERWWSCRSLSFFSMFALRNCCCEQPSWSCFI